MTPAQRIAKNLRQMVVLLWLLGALATLGYLVGIVDALSPGGDRFVDSGLVLTLAVQLFGIWVGLAWMGGVASGLAELLAPSSSA